MYQFRIPIIISNLKWYPSRIMLGEAPSVVILSEASCFALRIGKITMPPWGQRNKKKGKMENENKRFIIVYLRHYNIWGKTQF